MLRGFRPERLVEARLEKGLSRGDVARSVGVSIGAVGSWETGRATPQVDSLARTVEVLGLPIEAVIVVPESERYLSDLRALRGLVQPNLAATVGISTSSLASIERGEAPLSDGVAAKLASALAVELDVVERAYERARDRPIGVPG
ncbi:helix-turn-helix transcriptional regulator [Rhodococcoides trifolii]|uniref:helix-turn-helix transcriptional regulator n=1 Tax=Rhodococcoides trifolii TaxID=908250 RepID=UPI00227C271B|nr:helix-turn-helix transcriptional regulator [Rhodococcus trifolii]